MSAKRSPVSQLIEMGKILHVLEEVEGTEQCDGLNRSGTIGVKLSECNTRVDGEFFFTR
jgi:hypothetical protein